MRWYLVGMTSQAYVITVLAVILAHGAADITINTATPANECLKLNANQSTTHKPYIVNNLNLPKCCEFGWHLDLSAENEPDVNAPCVKGDNSVSIDMVHLPDKDAMFYEPIELTNYSLYVSTILKRPSAHYIDTDGRLVLNANGELGEMDDACSVIVWYTDFCVDYDASKDTLVGLWTFEKVNGELYTLVPCMAVSIACLMVVIIVYWWVPALNNLTGKALIGLAGCMLVMYSFLILQYSNPSDDTLVIENMQDISYLACGIWFMLLWCSLCANAWYYLPRNANMSRQQERRIVSGTVVLSLAFFGVMSSVALYTNRFPSQSVMLLVILTILLVCGGACLFSWVGFRRLREMQKLVYSAERNNAPHLKTHLQTFDRSEIDKARTMCTGASYIMFYAILCYGFKCTRQSVPVAYEMFNALAGFFIFLTFVCWRRSKVIITDFWRSRNTEVGLLQHNPNGSELQPMKTDTA